MNVTAASLFTNKRKRGGWVDVSKRMHTPHPPSCAVGGKGWFEADGACASPVLTDIKLTHISLRLLPHNAMQISCLKCAVLICKNCIDAFWVSRRSFDLSVRISYACFETWDRRRRQTDGNWFLLRRDIRFINFPISIRLHLGGLSKGAGVAVRPGCI